jgi:hypothetical protein
VGAAGGALFDGLIRIAMLGIDDKIGAQFGRQRQLAVIDIDRADPKPHHLGILNGQMPEAAGAGNDNPLARLRLGFLDALVGGDAGADQRCSQRRV